MVVFIVVQKFAANKVLSECCDYYLLTSYLLTYILIIACTSSGFLMMAYVDCL